MGEFNAQSLDRAMKDFIIVNGSINLIKEILALKDRALTLI